MCSIIFTAMENPLKFKTLNTLCLISAICIFISCSKEEVFDITGDASNKVYFNTETSYVNKYKFSVTHTPISEEGVVVAKFPVRCTSEASSELKVTLSIDNSLVNAFNTANSTLYSKIPDGTAAVINNILTIPKGNMRSSDSITVSIPSEAFSQLTDQGYVVPVKIVSVSNPGDATISTNLNTVFLIISTGWTNCYNGQALANMTGTLITPRTTWTASINVLLYSGTLPQMFDGNTNTYWQLRPPQKFELSVNLASEYPGISGIRISTNSTSYGLSQVRVYSSIDGVSWTYQGAPTLLTSSAYQYIRFYSAITAKFIKIETVSFRSTSRIYLGEFDVYKN
jgi:hypothetical protein